MNDSTRRLRFKLLTALATTGMVTSACGGSVDAGLTGGTGGQGATGGSVTGGTGGKSTGGTGGTSTGGVAGQGGLGGDAGSGGDAGFGGTAGVGGSAGFGGFAGAGGDGPFVKGTVDCNSCQSNNWTTCWKAGKVPVNPNTPPPTGACPSGYDIKWDAYEPCQDGWGAWYQQNPTFVDGYCCYETGLQCPGGRPFKVDGELRVAEVCQRYDWKGDLNAAAEVLDPTTAKALTSAWLGDAQLEHASVAAFARLTLELMALGAPASLVRESQAASIDEIKHAEDCFALASRYAKADLGPSQLSLDGVIGDITLEQLVRTTFEEGCVGETLAAVQAAAAWRVAGDETTRNVLEAIEREESDHAALAFRILRWALAVDPSLRQVVREELALAREREQHLDLVPMPDDVDLDAWHHHGRLTPSELIAARSSAFTEVVEPCVNTLLGEPDAEQRVALSALGA